jgi:hypothetical protein
VAFVAWLVIVTVAPGTVAPGYHSSGNPMPGRVLLLAPWTPPARSDASAPRPGLLPRIGRP